MMADAAYCGVLGVGLVVGSKPMGRRLGFNPFVMTMAGLASIMWSEFVRRASERPDWRPAVTTVAASNVVASAVFGYTVPKQPTVAAKWLMGLLALAVNAFAVIQFKSLFSRAEGRPDPDAVAVGKL